MEEYAMCIVYTIFMSLMLSIICHFPFIYFAHKIKIDDKVKDMDSFLAMIPAFFHIFVSVFLFIHVYNCSIFGVFSSCNIASIILSFKLYSTYKKMSTP